MGPDAVTLSGKSRSKRRVSVGLGCLGQRNAIGGGYGRDFGLRALSMERLLQDEFCWVGINGWWEIGIHSSVVEGGV